MARLPKDSRQPLFSHCAKRQISPPFSPSALRYSGGMDKEDSKRIDRLLGNVRLAIRDDLDVVKHDILDRLREIENSVELIARELARKATGRNEGEENRT